MKKLLLLLLLLIPNCAYVVDEFPASVSCLTVCNEEILQLAIDRWNASQGFEVFVFSPNNPEADITIEIVDYKPEGHSGFSFGTSPLIEIHRDFQTWLTFAHELGHKLGLSHSEDLYNIMSPDGTVYAFFYPIFPQLDY